MTKFVSQWKLDAPNQDVANLKYPYKPVDREGVELPGAVIETVEEAEELCDWLWANVNQTLGRDYLRRMAATTKLRDAWSRRQAVRDASIAKAVKKDEAFERKNQERARRAEAKAQAKLDEWMPEKKETFESIVRQIKTVTKKLAKIDHDFTEKAYTDIGAQANALGALVGILKSHHFGVTSSRVFATVKARAKPNHAEK